MRKQQIIKEFILTNSQVEQQSQLVTQAIKDGMQNKPSVFALLPSFLQLPQGNEQGRFLALDFGGSNVRVAKIYLEKQKVSYDAIIKQSLKELLSGKQNSVEELFVQIAMLINDVADEKDLLLGHTFSYPAKQTSENNAILKKWTKENFFVGGENIDINYFLYSKLKQLGRADIKPTVILNDTVATLITGSYCYNTKNAIGSICGTGHNSCYFDPLKNMVVNMESGNFSPSCKNQFDDTIDSQTIDLGHQSLEKMTAGNYLFRLVNLALDKAGEQKSCIKSTKDLEQIIALNEDNLLTDISRQVMIRAAKLVAAEYFGIYQYLLENNIIVEKIFLDGAVFNKIEIFKTQLKESLFNLIGEKYPQMVAIEQASLIGAAIASAAIENKNLSYARRK